MNQNKIKIYFYVYFLVLCLCALFDAIGGRKHPLPFPVPPRRSQRYTSTLPVVIAVHFPEELFMLILITFRNLYYYQRNDNDDESDR